MSDGKEPFGRDYVCPQCGPDPRGMDIHSEERHTWPPPWFGSISSTARQIEVPGLGGKTFLIEDDADSTVTARICGVQGGTQAVIGLQKTALVKFARDILTAYGENRVTVVVDDRDVRGALSEIDKEIGR